MILKKILKNKKGMTFIEIIITMGIIGFLSAAMLQVVNVFSVRQGLTLNADRVKAALRLAQSYSLSNPQSSGQQHICGYGVHTNGTNEMEVYVVYNTDYVSRPYECDNVDLDYNPGGTLNSNVERTVALDDGFTINCPDPFFKSPYRKVYSNGSSIGSGSTISCTLSRNSDGATQIIQLNHSGKINI